MPSAFASTCSMVSRLRSLALAARIADESGAAADERDRRVAEALQPRQAHDRQQRPDVQARRGRIEADVGGDRLGREHLVETFGAVVEQPAPAQFVEDVHAHHYTASLRRAARGAALT